MLNIVKIKKISNRKQYSLNNIKPEGDLMGIAKYYPSSTQEWKDSVYTFNKNTSKLIPAANNHIFNLIKSYFNMFSKNLEKQIKLPRIRKWKRRLLGRKVWISKPELKYSNQKILINIYIYNRQYTFLLKRLSILKANWGKILKIKKGKNLLFVKNKIVKILKIVYKNKYKKSIFYNAIEQLKTKIIESKDDYKKNIEKYEDILNFADFLEKNPKTLKIFINKYFSILIEKILTYQMFYLFYKQMILFNRLKFKDGFLMPIKWFLQKIYKKEIDLNLVSLKNFYYDSSILAQIVTSKIRNRKNKPLKVVKTSIRKSKIHEFNKALLSKEKGKLIKQNYVVGNYIYKYNHSSDWLNDILRTRLYSNNIQSIALNSIRNKNLIGIKVQASGRITRRIIAQRASCKVRYKGTLKNIDSSFKEISTAILKGYEKSTLQYSHLGSKRRIGAFGIKGWINAY